MHDHVLTMTYDTPGGPAKYNHWAAKVRTYPNCWNYHLDEDADLHADDFFSMSGKIDVLHLGMPYGSAPISDSGGTAYERYSENCWLPDPSSSTFDEIVAYMASGGTVLVNAVYRRKWTSAEETWSIDKRTQINDFLDALGTSTRIVASEDLSIPFANRALDWYAVAMTPYGRWSINPDTWLGSGQASHRVFSNWIMRARCDARSQAGVSLSSAYSINLSDFTLSPDQAYGVPLGNSGFTYFGNPYSQELSHGLTVTASLADAYAVVPMVRYLGDNASEFSLVDFLRTKVFTNPPYSYGYRWQPFANGIIQLYGDRFNRVLATAERIGGGKLIVMSEQNTVDGVYARAIESMIRQKSGCNHLASRSVMTL